MTPPARHAIAALPALLLALAAFASPPGASGAPDAASPAPRASPSLSPVPSPPPPPATAEAWRATLAAIAAERDVHARQLRLVLAELRPRVEHERGDLLARLDAKPPTPVPWGYALLPTIRPVLPPISEPPVEKVYTMPGFRQWILEERRRTQEIADRLACGAGPADLDRLVDSYQARTDAFLRIDSTVGYTALWQDHAHRRTIDLRPELLAAWRTWRSPDRDPAARKKAAEAEERLRAWMEVFQPRAGLAIRRAPDGACVLPLPIATDIEDESFLAAFAEAIDLVWTRSPAMAHAGLRLAIEWDRRRPEALYPEGPPAPGAHIALGPHVDRFGPGRLVLTTGADSLHVLGGAIVVRAGAENGRALGHELAHLLGFADAYARTFAGKDDDPEGFEIRELIPFPGSLIANPGTGTVTDAMAARLVEAYD